jgi:hypothetical protein
MSMFRYVHFLYAIFVMIMIYLRINLKLKLLFFLIKTPSQQVVGSWFLKIDVFQHQKTPNQIECPP